MPKNHHLSSTKRKAGGTSPAWQSLAQTNVIRNIEGSVAKRLTTAIQHSRDITIRYNGGSYANKARSIQPRRIFSKGGETYVEAICARENEMRIFKLELISIEESDNNTPQIQSTQKPYTPVVKGSGCLVLFLLVPASLAVVFQVIATIIT